eukprot:GHRR01000610.1.p1 GENE.GHRR01000610.1~~GHRR01000610.1.p1  ORF type:complete len:344 (+),score=81.40 GHRR01000610.1:198-1229(+)
MSHLMSRLLQGRGYCKQIRQIAPQRFRQAGRSRVGAVKPRPAYVVQNWNHSQQLLDNSQLWSPEHLERLYHLSPVPQAACTSSLVHSGEALWPHGVFLVSVDDKPPKATKNQEKCPDYYANVGDAIRTLREDIPQLFERELNYDIYREDITFKDPRNTFAGMKNYKLIFWSLRFHGRIFFKKLYVEVRRIWQPQDGLICMRWTVHGIPRVPWEAEGTFDGISQYKLDSEGKIYEHAVDNVILRDPPMQGVGPLLAGLNLVPGTPQQPCPGAWFKGLEKGAAAAASAANAAASSIGSNSWLTAIVHFSWVHLYAALLGTMQLQAADQLVPATAAVTGTQYPESH